MFQRGKSTSFPSIIFLIAGSFSYNLRATSHFSRRWMRSPCCLISWRANCSHVHLNIVIDRATRSVGLPQVEDHEEAHPEIGLDTVLRIVSGADAGTPARGMPAIP
jgi:hypothetical protein